jgi:hypothetical protein
MMRQRKNESKLIHQMSRNRTGKMSLERKASLIMNSRRQRLNLNKLKKKAKMEVKNEQ